MNCKPKSSLNRFVGVIATALMLLNGLLSGCQSPASTDKKTEAGSARSGRVLRFGYQKGSPSNLLKARGDLDRRLAEQGVKVEWSNYPAGPQLLEALGVGSIDFGATGESPVIFAQAAGIPVVYVATMPPAGGDGEGQAILVPKDSPIKSVADLKGKKIAFQKASSSHNFVIQVIERVGLTYKDIKPIYLAPPDARPAFESGNIDAWAIWDPFLAAAQKKTQARILANGKGILTAGGFYLSSRKYVKEQSDILKIVLEELNKVGDWSYAHKDEAAQQIAKDTGIELPTLQLVMERQIRAVIRPMNAETIAAQQTVADNFYRIGLLPKKVNVRDGILTPGEYALFMPLTVDSANTVAQENRKQ